MQRTNKVEVSKSRAIGPTLANPNKAHDQALKPNNHPPHRYLCYRRLQHGNGAARPIGAGSPAADRQTPTRPADRPPSPLSAPQSRTGPPSRRNPVQIRTPSLRRQKSPAPRTTSSESSKVNSLSTRHESRGAGQRLCASALHRQTWPTLRAANRNPQTANRDEGAPMIRAAALHRHTYATNRPQLRRDSDST